MAAQEFEMIFQPLLPPGVTKAPTTQVCRALPDGQVQPFNVGRVELARVLRIAPHLIPTPSRTEAGFPLHFYHAIISPFLNDLAVYAGCPKESSDNLPIEPEPIGSDQRHVVSIVAGTDVSKQCEGISIAPLTNDGEGQRRDQTSMAAKIQMGGWTLPPTNVQISSA